MSGGEAEEGREGRRHKKETGYYGEGNDDKMEREDTARRKTKQTQ